MLAAFGYLAAALMALEVDKLAGRLSGRGWVLTLLASLAYAAALVLLTQAWLLLAAPRRRLPLVIGLAIYGPAVIAKYLPGSVFQYVSRQALGATRGLSQGEMARSSVVEVLLHLAAAIGVAIAMLLANSPAVPVVLFAGGLIVSLLARHAVVKAAGLQCAFFAAFAGIVLLLATAVFQVDEPVRLAALFLLAWLAGFLVPVAPGGIGVREAALLALAVPGESALLVALFAVTTRVVTIVGDALFGLSAYLVTALARENRQAP